MKLMISLSFLLFAGHLSAQPEVPVPAALPDSLVTVAIPNVHGTLDAAQAIADRILPEAHRVDLKNLLGESLGTPGLGGIPEDSGAVWIWDGVNSFGLLQCTPEAAAAMGPFLTASQLLSAPEGHRILISKTPAGLEAGKSSADAAVTALLGSDTAGVFVNLRSADLVTHFKPQIDMGLMMMPAMMTQSAAQMPEDQAASIRGMARFVEAEMRVLVSLASQLDLVGVSLGPAGESLEYAYTFVVKEQTPLHALVTAPDVIGRDPRITAANLTPGMFGIEMYFGNPDALLTFLQAEADQLTSQMTLDPDVAARLKELFAMWPAFVSGSMAETFDMNPESGMFLEYVGTVPDPERFMTAIQSLREQMRPLMDMYRNMGMPMEMELNLDARTYRDIPVHQYKFRYVLEDMAPEMAEQFRQMGMAEMNSELAVTDGRALWTMGTDTLDRLIDRMATGETGDHPLHAHRVYLDGGVAYFDFDLGAYLGFISGFMPPEVPVNPFAPMADMLKESPPVTSAVFKQDNRVRMSFTLPDGILKAFVSLWAVETTEESSEPVPAGP